MTATMGKDVGGIIASIAKIQDDIGIGKELLDCLVSIGISDFDPSDDLKQSSFGPIQLIIKRIFRALDPYMPINDSISILCKVILERDPSPIIKLIKQIIPDT